MKRVTIAILAAYVMTSPASAAAMAQDGGDGGNAKAAQSACAPLLESGQDKGIKFGKDAQKTGLFGAIVGGVGGAVIALTTSDDKDKTGDVAQAAAIGAAIGGAMGVGIGQIAENRRAAFESESAYLDCEISYAEEELARREEEAVKAEEDLAAAMAEAEELRAKIAANEAKEKDLKKLRKQWNKKIKQYDSELEALNEQIEYFNVLATHEATSSGENPQALEKRRQELAMKKGELQIRYNRIAAVRDEFIVQSNALRKA